MTCWAPDLEPRSCLAHQVCTWIYSLQSRLFSFGLVPQQPGTRSKCRQLLAHVSYRPYLSCCLAAGPVSVVMCLPERSSSAEEGSLKLPDHVAATLFPVVAFTGQQKQLAVSVCDHTGGAPLTAMWWGHAGHEGHRIGVHLSDLAFESCCLTQAFGHEAG